MWVVKVKTYTDGKASGRAYIYKYGKLDLKVNDLVKYELGGNTLTGIIIEGPYEVSGHDLPYAASLVKSIKEKIEVKGTTEDQQKLEIKRDKRFNAQSKINQTPNKSEQKVIQESYNAFLERNKHSEKDIEDFLMSIAAFKTPFKLLPEDLFLKSKLASVLHPTFEFFLIRGYSSLALLEACINIIEDTDIEYLIQCKLNIFENGFLKVLDYINNKDQLKNIFDTFTKYGADIKIKDHYKRNYMHILEKPQTLELFRKSININLNDSDSQTPLMSAILNNNFEKAQYLYSHGGYIHSNKEYKYVIDEKALTFPHDYNQDLFEDNYNEKAKTHFENIIKILYRLNSKDFFFVNGFDNGILAKVLFHNMYAFDFTDEENVYFFNIAKDAFKNKTLKTLFYRRFKTQIEYVNDQEIKDVLMLFKEHNTRSISNHTFNPNLNHLLKLFSMKHQFLIKDFLAQNLMVLQTELINEKHVKDMLFHLFEIKNNGFIKNQYINYETYHVKTEETVSHFYTFEKQDIFNLIEHITINYKLEHITISFNQLLEWIVEAHQLSLFSLRSLSNYLTKFTDFELADKPGYNNEDTINFYKDILQSNDPHKKFETSRVQYFNDVKENKPLTNVSETIRKSIKSYSYYFSERFTYLNDNDRGSHALAFISMIQILEIFNSRYSITEYTSLIILLLNADKLFNSKDDNFKTNEKLPQEGVTIINHVFDYFNNEFKNKEEIVNTFLNHMIDAIHIEKHRHPSNNADLYEFIEKAIDTIKQEDKEIQIILEEKEMLWKNKSRRYPHMLEAMNHPDHEKAITLMKYLEVIESNDIKQIESVFSKEFSKITQELFQEEDWEIFKVVHALIDKNIHTALKHVFDMYEVSSKSREELKKYCVEIGQVKSFSIINDGIKKNERNV